MPLHQDKSEPKKTKGQYLEDILDIYKEIENLQDEINILVEKARVVPLNEIFDTEETTRIIESFYTANRSEF